MDKKTFIDILQENNPESMMKFLLANGKKPKAFSPFIFLSDKEMEEFRNGANNERINEGN